MAWFGFTNKNAGVKAYRPAFADPDEVKYGVVDYSASHNTYVSESEQVIHFKGGAPPAIQEYYNKHSPGKIGLLNGHGVREEPHFGPWIPAHDNRAKKDDVLSPRAHAGHRPRSLARDHGPKRGDEFSPRAHVGHRPRSPARDHGPKRGDEFSPRAQLGHQPWSQAHNYGSKKGDGFSPKARVQEGHGPNKGSPHGTHAYQGNSPPSRDHYDSPRRGHGKYNNFNSDESDVESDYGHDSDVECEDGVCYRKGSRPKPNNNHLIGQNYDHDKERHKLGDSYSPPTSYPNVPKKDPYYEKTYPKDNDHKPHKGNNFNIPPYEVPLATSPRKDTYYDHQSNNPHHQPPPIKTRIDTHQPHYESPRNPHHQPPPIKTRIDTHQPQYESPRKEYRGHPKTIDSAEARRKYGTTSSRDGAYVEGKYKGTIDSVTAAKKYNGVFVPNK